MSDMEAAAVPAVDVAERAPSGVVAAKDITRRYGEGDTAVDALRGVSLEVQQGKLTAVMGPRAPASRP
jgi:putative ABC transport system ATP-binding protein